MPSATPSRESLEKILRNEPLVEAVPSIAGVQDSLFGEPGGSIFYGTGVTTPKELSVGLPFDVLGMILVAERLRRTLGLSRIVHHIADTHAMANPFASRESVDALAQDASRVVSLIAARFRFPALTVVRSSDFDSRPEYLGLLDGIDTQKGSYVQRELADVRWYRKNFKTALKLGWIIQASETAEGFDERLYDREYQRVFADDMSFVYMKAGRTFDPRRPKAPPYISVASELRIRLHPDEKVGEKLAQAKGLWRDTSLGGAANHLNSILRLYERLVEPLGAGPLEERIERVLARVFGPEDAPLASPTGEGLREQPQHTDSN